MNFCKHIYVFKLFYVIDQNIFFSPDLLKFIIAVRANTFPGSVICESHNTDMNIKNCIILTSNNNAGCSIKHLKITYLYYGSKVLHILR